MQSNYSLSTSSNKTSSDLYMKIQAAKDKHKSLGDKRAIEYLKTEEFDLKDLKAILAAVIPKENEAFVRDDNAALLEQAFGEMTLIKRSRDEGGGRKKRRLVL